LTANYASATAAATETSEAGEAHYIHVYAPPADTECPGKKAQAAATAAGKKQHDLFITDVEYDADETKLGIVHTGTEITLEGSTQIAKKAGQSMPLFAGFKQDSIVRFVSTVSNTVTDYMMVRELVAVGPDELVFRVDSPVLLVFDNDFYCYLVREWIQRTLKLNTRFQLVTACEVKAFAFTGIS
jgi:hypothetical protein